MNTNNLSLCANCGRGDEESLSLKNCVACKMVKYCSKDCQKAHRPQHKKECRKRAAELQDEALFKQPPPQLEDCPICFLRLPTLETGWRYQVCCGKTICSGCFYAAAKMDGNADQLCPFCRAPAPSEEEATEREKKRVEVNDAFAIFNLGCYYKNGIRGLPQDRDKALELWHRAAEFGCTAAYYNIGNAYSNGVGVARDKKKAVHYWELAAIVGAVDARHNLGNAEIRAGNYGRALKHYMIAAGSGHHGSLKNIKQMYSARCATRDDYTKALKHYQAYLEEIKSDGRDKAAAFEDECKYYE